MSMTDPIADFLTRVRNASRARHSKVDVPASNIVIEMTKTLCAEGYIANYTVIEDQKQGSVRIYLKYDENRKSAISGIRRISRPGYRQYTSAKEIPRILNGLGIAIMSTPKGIMTDKVARQKNMGGELLCSVW